MATRVNDVQAVALLEAARSAGVELWVEGRRLRFRAPPEALSPALRDGLKTNRDEVIELLRSEAEGWVEDGALAENQRGLWFVQRLVADNSAYNLSISLRLWDSLDVALLEEAVQVLVDRHSSLRSSYPLVDGVPRRRVVGSLVVAVSRKSVRGLNAERTRATVEAEAARPFDLETGPVFRTCLFEEQAGHHVLLLTVHHIAIDGTSLFLLLDELLAVYSALATAQSVPPRPDGAGFEEFVEWQQATLAKAEAQQAYWNGVLDPPPTPLGLPTDWPRPQIPALRGSSVTRTVDADLTEALRDLARRHGVTDYVCLLSLWAAFLCRLSGQGDIIVGASVQGRPSARFATTMGDLVNILPLRFRQVGDQTLDQLLQEVRTVVIEGMSRQDFPLPRMLESLEHRTERVVRPFETMFALQDFTRFSLFERLMLAPETERIQVGALTLGPFPIRQQEGQFELSLEVWPRGRSLLLALRYDTELFEVETAEAWADALLVILRAAASSAATAPVSLLPLLDSGRRQELVERWNASDRGYPQDRTVAVLFAEQAARRPNAVAVRFQDQSLSYRELELRASRLAGYLRRIGVDREILVGVHLDRGPEMLVAVLAVLKAGGAYVPLDPDFPTDRLRYMVNHSGAPVLLSHTQLEDVTVGVDGVTRVCLDHLMSDGILDTVEPWCAAPAPQDRAYVIYTSGSTGRPKGVEIEHRALTNFLWSMGSEPGLDQDDVLMAVTTLSFDIAALELFLPLIRGARIELVSRSTATDPARLASHMAEAGVTLMQATPATWRMLLEYGWQGDGRLKVLCGGEALGRDLVHRLLPTCGELWNMYGPTETTIWSSVARIRSDDPITIGCPIANTRMYVLDSKGEPVPVGVPGELWIGGDGVARGYLHQPELTTERFRDNPFHPGRMYCTGDLARYRPDGRLECLGRVDDQVKIRGYRIELGEIEAVLAAHPEVSECAVALGGSDNNRRLIACYVGDAAPAALRQFLRGRLPDYMVPAFYLPMAALPRTPNNKIDRKRLPDAPAAEPNPGDGAPLPRTPTERAIAGIWQDLLDVSGVRLQDNFFDLGGHSLLAATCTARVERTIGIRLNPRELIFQTLEQLAASCDQRRRGVAPAEDSGIAQSVPLQRDKETFFFGPEEAPLFGSFHPPGNGMQKATGMLMVYPMGQEYMRCHRAIYQLTGRLSRRGFPSLRFDFHGCGDSWGDHEETSLRQWQRDLHRAAEELGSRCGLTGKALCGMRMGATLAVLVAAERDDVDCLVLWNPVVNGRVHREELAMMQKQMLRRSYVSAALVGPAGGPETTEILGFPFSSLLLAELNRIDLLTLDRCPARRVLLVDSVGDSQLDSLTSHLGRLGACVDRLRFDGPRLWLEEPFKEVVPVEIWRAAETWFDEVAP
ncbi:amino acid adenylation domain-containing protein [Methylonatrum kenyense]|uniref:non-ribosomal peptide synthetase n=1 Tax=Methylonatrum kenyense TaxID=455253 RepID=UPI0020BFE36C|nr:amino acid adenylation domain-containing protein [Methylonatrum kenyense]MCK8516797.1 amino acid adenylation domain-containing protein [Methylonatrum kenyense]